MAPVKALAEWKARVYRHWPQVRIRHVESDIPGEILAGTASSAWAEIYLGGGNNHGGLTPDDVKVELYYGMVDANGEILQPQIVEMQGNQNGADGVYAFAGSVICRSTGQHGFTVRVVPRHPDLVNPFEMGLIFWG